MVSGQVVTAPVIGKVAQTGVERMVGTIVGGWLGYGTYVMGRKVWDEFSDGVRRLFFVHGLLPVLGMCLLAKFHETFCMHMHSLCSDLSASCVPAWSHAHMSTKI